MIHIRRMKDTDIEQVNGILKDYDLTFESFMDRVENLMVIDDNGIIKGFSSFLSENDYALMDFLLVATSHQKQKFGDGLFKATLNLMELNGIKSVDVVSVTNSNGFFEQLDLKAHDSVSLKLKPVYNASSVDTVFYTRLPDFFNTACHSKKKA